jgi:hypothetical protein
VRQALLEILGATHVGRETIESLKVLAKHVYFRISTAMSHISFVILT